jgi:hypothetical protein
MVDALQDLLELDRMDASDAADPPARVSTKLPDLRCDGANVTPGGVAGLHRYD